MNQRWLFGNILFLFCCIAVSQQFGILNAIKNPKQSIAIGITDIVDDINKIKNGVNDALNTVSPNILGPIADTLDPEWLTGMNYTRWILDLQTALNENDTEKWVKTMGLMLDIPRVIDEVKTSATSKASCLACKFLVNLVRSMLTTNKTEDDILNLATQICTVLNIQTSRVCSGIVQLLGIDVVEVVKMSDMLPAQICSFLLADACANGYDKRHDWKIQLSTKKKTSIHPTRAPLANAPRLKVLQVSDTHYDPYYEIGANADCDEPLCCRAADGPAKSDDTAARKWGDYRKCDAPRILFENALQHMADTHKDVDYIIWTGDLPPHDVWNQTREENLSNLKFSAALMAKYFKGIPIFPSVGNHESCPVDSYAPSWAPARKNMSWLYDQLDAEWSRWLPSDTSETIRQGAFYSAIVKPGFRIISVNGNYCSKNNFWLLLNSTDPAGELAWLVRELEAAESKGEKVHIIGHVPPGQPDCLKVWSKNYYDIIDRFESTIMAQFFGHTHFDEYEVFYDNVNFTRPLSIGYISPSVTPWENVNPSYRIYYVDDSNTETKGAIIDHDTWKMDLDEANLNDNPVWYKAYTATKAYNMTSLRPQDWNDLHSRMIKNNTLFDTYYRNYYRDSPVRPNCDHSCGRKLLCDIRSGRSHDTNNLCHDI